MVGGFSVFVDVFFSVLVVLLLLIDMNSVIVVWLLFVLNMLL